MADRWQVKEQAPQAAAGFHTPADLPHPESERHGISLANERCVTFEFGE
jgi:hypothetical protein